MIDDEDHDNDGDDDVIATMAHGPLVVALLVMRMIIMTMIKKKIGDRGWRDDRMSYLFKKK